MSRPIFVWENITTKALLAYVLRLGFGPDRSGKLDICNSVPEEEKMKEANAA